MKPVKEVTPNERKQLTLRMDDDTNAAALRLRAKYSQQTGLPISLNEAICAGVRLADSLTDELSGRDSAEAVA